MPEAIKKGNETDVQVFFTDKSGRFIAEKTYHHPNEDGWI